MQSYYIDKIWLKLFQLNSQQRTAKLLLWPLWQKVCWQERPDAAPEGQSLVWWFTFIPSSVLTCQNVVCLWLTIWNKRVCWLRYIDISCLLKYLLLILCNIVVSFSFIVSFKNENIKLLRLTWIPVFWWTFWNAYT